MHLINASTSCRQVVYCTPVILSKRCTSVSSRIYTIHTHSYTSTQLHAAPSNLPPTKGTLSIPEGPLSWPLNPTLITLIASYTPLVSMSPSGSIAKCPLVPPAPLVGVCAAPFCLSEQVTIWTIELRLIDFNSM